MAFQRNIKILAKHFLTKIINYNTSRLCQHQKHPDPDIHVNTTIFVLCLSLRGGPFDTQGGAL